MNWYDFYTSIGWKIVPLRPKSKIPLLKEWNKDYNSAATKTYFLDDKYNLGLLLGEVVDIEADNPFANALLDNLVKDIDHPIYKSRKSTHHLFTCPFKFTRKVINGIEFRGFKHQSVLPPSIVGIIEYKWISTNNFIIPSLPKPLVELYRQHDKSCKSKYWITPTCGICGRKSRPIHRKRFDLELKTFKTLNKKWICHGCRDVDIREMCRKMKSSGLINIHEGY